MKPSECFALSPWPAYPCTRIRATPRPKVAPLRLPPNGARWLRARTHTHTHTPPNTTHTHTPSNTTRRAPHGRGCGIVAAARACVSTANERRARGPSPFPLTISHNIRRVGRRGVGGGHSQCLGDAAKQPKLGWDRTAQIIVIESAVTHTVRERRPSVSGRAPSDRGED